MHFLINHNIAGIESEARAGGGPRSSMMAPGAFDVSFYQEKPSRGGLWAWKSQYLGFTFSWVSLESINFSELYLFITFV